MQRSKAYAFINIAGLTLGLACAMLILLYVKDEVSYDRFHANAPQLYRICSKNIKPDGSTGGQGSITGIFQGPRFAASIPEIKTFVRYQHDGRDLKNGTSITGQDVVYTDNSFFSAFSFPLLYGDPAKALAAPRSVVISEDMAQKQFGTRAAVGKVMLFRKDSIFEPYTVTAVAKRCPQNSSIRFDILMPLQVSAQDAANRENWLAFFLHTFVVLQPGANIKAVEAKIRRVYETEASDMIKLARDKYNFQDRTEYFLQPFTSIHLGQVGADNGLNGHSNPIFSYILSGIAIFILLIACINFVNLTVARSVKRAREIGIRKVVGGGRQQLMLQFMGESFLLCFIAFTLAIGLTQLVLPLFNDLSDKALSLSYLLDAKLITGYGLLFLATGLLAGFYPAVVLSGYRPVETLYSRFTLSGKNYLQKALVVLQFALASFLIIATMTVYFQFRYLTTQKLGYDDTNLITVGKNNLTRSQAKLFKDELMKNPDIVDVAPKNSGSWGTMARAADGQELHFAWETVDESYLPVMKIPLAQGRNFSTAFPADSAVSVLVNETLVKKAGWKNPIGQTLNFWFMDKTYTVIGVVKDYHYQSLTSKIDAQLFTMKPSNEFGMVNIKIKPGGTAAALQHIQRTFSKLFPMYPYSYYFVDQENQKSYESEARWQKIMLCSAVLTIFISCIGLFGLSVLAAEKRTKEIGIRKVLGASVSGVVATLSKDFLQLVLLSLAAAIPLSWMAASKWLEHYPYRIALSWWMFAGAGVLVIGIALFTVSFQAVKAAVANPVKSLRNE